MTSTLGYSRESPTWQPVPLDANTANVVNKNMFTVIKATEVKIISYDLDHKKLLNYSHYHPSEHK